MWVWALTQIFGSCRHIHFEIPRRRNCSSFATWFQDQTREHHIRFTDLVASFLSHWSLSQTKNVCHSLRFERLRDLTGETKSGCQLHSTPRISQALAEQWCSYLPPPQFVSCSHWWFCPHSSLSTLILQYWSSELWFKFWHFPNRFDIDYPPAIHFWGRPPLLKDACSDLGTRLSGFSSQTCLAHTWTFAPCSPASCSKASQYAWSFTYRLPSYNVSIPAKRLLGKSWLSWKREKSTCGSASFLSWRTLGFGYKLMDSADGDLDLPSPC